MLDDLMSNPWAYLPPRSSLWLWIGGPLLLILVYFLTTRSTKERLKRLREVEIWRASIEPVPARADNKSGAPYRPDPAKKAQPPKKKKKDAGPPRVQAVPVGLHGALFAVGGGDPIAHYALVADLAYLSLMEANLTAGSDYQAVIAKLEEVGPQFTVRPLPLVDGVPVPNTGVQFKKDPEFMSLFLVEGTDAKAIGRWLSPPLRRALCEAPWAWLRVQGKSMSVAAFGSLEADRIDALVELADTVFAEHGAEGGPSLFGEEEERSAAAPVVTSKPSAGKPAKKAPSEAVMKTLAETPFSKKKT